MPIFIPNNLQGAGNTATTPLVTLAPPLLLLEWGHFIDSTPNLLFADGGANIINTSAEAITVTLQITQDAVVIDTRQITLGAGSGASASVGARQENLAVGHHVYQLLAQITAGDIASTANVTNKEVSTISGPATPGT
jgi:hypothetical protein